MSHDGPHIADGTVGALTIMKIQTAFVLIAAGTSAAAMGCGSSSDKPGNTGTSRVSLHRAKDCGGLLSDLKADAAFKLNKGIDLQIEGIQKCVARTGNDQSCAYGGYVGGYGYGGGPVGFGEGDASNATPPGAPVPSAGAQGTSTGGTTGAGSAPADQATSHSDTNNQVKGVDEADFVKTDGKNLYVIHGNAFKVLQAWPANDLKELSSLTIEGTPTEMFVDSGKAVVYSEVNGASLYTAAGVTPKDSYEDFAYATGGVGYATPGTANVVGGAPSTAPNPGPGGVPQQPQQYIPLTKITVLSLDGAGASSVTREMYFEGSYLDSRRVGTHVRTVLSGNAHGPKLKNSVYDLYPQPAYNGGPGAPSSPDSPPTDTTKSGTGTAPGGTGTGGTPTPVGDPAQPVNPYPQTGTAMIAALEQLRAANQAAIDGSQLSDWIPYTFTKNGGAVAVSSIACEDFYVPSTGSTESGLTEVASIDLANPGALARESAILGRAETVYASQDTIYLAAQAWVETPYSWNDGPTGISQGGTAGSAGSGTVMAGSTTASPPPPPAPTPAAGGVGTKTLHPRDATTATPLSVTAWATNKTHLHKFEFATDANFPNYVASGTVVGNIKDQFSLDDKDGYLRVATSESRMYLDQDGKYLQPTFPGDTTGAQDRPQNVNHVFTLGVNGGWLDLAGDAGELAPNEQIYSVRFVEGRGYVVTFRRVDPLFVIDLSNPSSPTKVAELTIPGFSEYMHPLDATHLMTIGRAADASGHVQGLQLQIFDVTDATNPIASQKFTYSNNEYGYSDAENDHKAFTYFADQGMLAFPYYGYTPNAGSPDGGMHSSLELFKVDAATGFSKLGSIDHTSLVASYPGGYCGGYYGPQVRRGVFLDNFVYSISYGGVIAKDANNLASAGAELALSAPQVNDGYGPSCGVGAPPTPGTTMGGVATAATP
jgi:hypothetical protein